MGAVTSNLDHLLPWMPWAKEEPVGLEARVEWLRKKRAQFDLGQDFGYGIFNREEATVLGSGGLHTRLGEGVREIGCWIHKDHINQGLATEAAASLAKVAFEVDKVKRVEIHCDVQNVRSAAVPRKLGFIHEATLQKRFSYAELRDAMIWTLFAEDYPASPSAQAEIVAFDVIGRKLL
jgi:RimJ/RimL family protein N-acetyltransferase